MQTAAVHTVAASEESTPGAAAERAGGRPTHHGGHCEVTVQKLRDTSERRCPARQENPGPTEQGDGLLETGLPPELRSLRRSFRKEAEE